MSTRSHDEHKENLGPYVLGALPELETELLERHLAGCESCRSELDELRPVAAALARSVPQIEPPLSLKARLMETVNAEAAARVGRVAKPRRQRRSFGDWLAVLQPRTAAALALSVLAIGVVVGVAADQLGGGHARNATIAAQIDRNLMPRGNAVLAVDGSRGKLVLSNAPQPPAGRVYQLWYRQGRTIERGRTFVPQSDGSYRADVSVAHTDAVMVTVEHRGGAPAPTGPPVMLFNI